MNTVSKHISEGLGASVSLMATITAWQVEIEFWLRVSATLVAIAAGLVTIWSAMRKKPPQP